MRKRDNSQNQQVPNVRDDKTQDRMDEETRQEEVPDVRQDKTRDRTNQKASQNEGKLRVECVNSADVITWHIMTFIASLLAFYYVSVGN